MADVLANWGAGYRAWLRRAIDMKQRNPDIRSVVQVGDFNDEDPPLLSCPKCWFTKNADVRMQPLSGDKFVCSDCGHREPF